MSVRINPGDMELTRMLSGASSTASWVIMMRTAPLVAPYMLKRCSGNAICEAIDAISTKLPPVPCLLMADAASCAQKYVPRTWTVSSSRDRECDTYIDLQEPFTFIPLVVEERLVGYNASSSHAFRSAIDKKNLGHANQLSILPKSCSTCAKLCFSVSMSVTSVLLDVSAVTLNLSFKNHTGSILLPRQASKDRVVAHQVCQIRRHCFQLRPQLLLGTYQCRELRLL
jgi:hypothetical protein